MKINVLNFFATMLIVGMVSFGCGDSNQAAQEAENGVEQTMDEAEDMMDEAEDSVEAIDSTMDDATEEVEAAVDEGKNDEEN